MNKQARASLMLTLTAVIWGSSFVAQSVGMDYIGPFTFNGVRNIVGTLFLIPVILLFDYLKKRSELKMDVSNKSQKIDEETKKAQKKDLIVGGIVCGVVMFIASSLQQIGIMYTTAGKTGFITALYIILVPILGLFLKKKVRPIIWLGVALAAIGLYLLCIKEDFTIGKGDFLVLICALFFAVHILVIDHFSPKVDGIRMSCLQFFVCGMMSIVPMFIFEAPNISSILDASVPILYARVLSCGIAYTLQIVAQKDIDPTVASLILSLEAVFAAIAGFIILHEVLLAKELIGCALMFGAIVLAQLPEKGKV